MDLSCSGTWEKDVFLSDTKDSIETSSNVTERHVSLRNNHLYYPDTDSDILVFNI